MKETALITTPDSVELEVPLAGPASRFGAFLVDFLLLCMVWLLGWFGIVQSGALVLSDLTGMAVAVMVMFMFVSTWGYAVAFELAWRGQTPGKRWAGLRVIREDGLPVGPREVWLRNLCRAVDMWPPPSYFVGLVTMMVDPHGRRLGDLVAGTLVVRESLAEVRTTKSGAAWAERAEKGQAHKALVLSGGSLSARQLAAIEQFLERRTELAPDRRQEFARRMVAPIQEILGEDLRLVLERDGPEQVLEGVWTLAQRQDTPTAGVQAVGKGLF